MTKAHIYLNVESLTFLTKYTLNFTFLIKDLMDEHFDFPYLRYLIPTIRIYKSSNRRRIIGRTTSTFT